MTDVMLRVSPSVDVEATLRQVHEDRALGGYHTGRMNEGDAYMFGYLQAVRDVGLITDMEHMGWKFRMSKCPGPVGGGQKWCAYCGEIGDGIPMHPREDD